MEREKGVEPTCYARACLVADLMSPGFDPWLYAFRLYACEEVRQSGMVVEILKDTDPRDKWLKAASQYVIAAMVGARNEALEDKRETDRRKRQVQAALRGKK